MRILLTLSACLGYTAGYNQPIGSVPSAWAPTVEPVVDPILVDPNASSNDKDSSPLLIKTSGLVVSGLTSSSTVLPGTPPLPFLVPLPGNKLVASADGGKTTYLGSTTSYLDLVEPQEDKEGDGEDGFEALKRLLPPLPKVSLPLLNKDYVPMQDLFTSPLVSYAYERGWRQGFAAAGFPGVEKEYEMVRDFFKDEGEGGGTVVDMSCGSGLFTRRLALGSNGYSRVVACDYSESMLTEARSRYVAASYSARQSNPSLSPPSVDFIRLDVANLPFRSGSVDRLNAAAAMHCWPAVDAGLAEIHRSLKPGGRFFASTFLSRYFSAGGLLSNSKDVKRQSFQMFESADAVRDLVVAAGFKDEDVEVQLLEPACIIVKAKKAEAGEEKVEEAEVNEGGVLNATVLGESGVNKPEGEDDEAKDWEVKI